MELPRREFRGLFEVVIAVSLGLHVAIVLMLPSAARTRAAVLPTFIEVGELPPPPAPAVTAPSTDPKEEPAPEPAPRIAARATSKATTLRAPAKEASMVTNPTSETADFTSTVLSSADGPGVAIPSAPAARPAAATGSARVSAAAGGPRFVDAANLAKAPRAPPLDTSLEKNYPPEARRSRISGSAILRLQILPDGRVGVVRRVSETYAGFAEACERTVKAGTWEPPIDRGGRPVATEITFMCRFEVKG
jgi:protein TonB